MKMKIDEDTEHCYPQEGELIGAKSTSEVDEEEWVLEHLQLDTESVDKYMPVHMEKTTSLSSEDPPQDLLGKVHVMKHMPGGRSARAHSYKGEKTIVFGCVPIEVRFIIQDPCLMGQHDDKSIRQTEETVTVECILSREEADVVDSSE